jgi:hypothetical protein
MVSPRALGYDAVHNREILILPIAEPITPFTLARQKGRQFACFCAMDASQFSIGEIGIFANVFYAWDALTCRPRGQIANESMTLWTR